MISRAKASARQLCSVNLQVIVGKHYRSCHVFHYFRKNKVYLIIGISEKNALGVSGKVLMLNRAAEDLVKVLC